jgi:hypothetical protein
MNHGISAQQKALHVSGNYTRHLSVMKISITILISFLLCFATNSFCQNTDLTAYKNCFDSDLKDWTNSFKDFQLSRFTLSDTIKFENLPFGDIGDLKEFYKLYEPALSFSSDNTQFLDIYSYWLNLEKKGNKVVANPEVDQLVSLCDLKSNKWTRIFFCGLSTRIDEAIWLTNTKFILAGTLLDENNEFHPKILIGDTTKQIFIVYSDSSSVARKIGYTSTKLKKLNIQDE